MFNCYVHNWSSRLEMCPVCPQQVVTSTDGTSAPSEKVPGFCFGNSAEIRPLPPSRSICEFCNITASDIFKKGFDKALEQTPPALSEVERAELMEIKHRLKGAGLYEDDSYWLLKLIERLTGERE